MLIKVIILLICHLVESKPIDGNRLNEVKSIYSKEDKFPYICELSPYSDEGHYFLSNDPERSNIIDGEPGIKLHLIIRLINARTCEPLKGVYVHIWHANAKGEYSGVHPLHPKSGVQFNSKSTSRRLSIVGEEETNGPFDESRKYQKTRNTEDVYETMDNTRTKTTSELNNPFNYVLNPKNFKSNSELNLKKRSVNPASIKSQNFLRGYQISNDDGEVSFTTIIPGWYKGRAQHIHIEVHPDKSTSKPMYIGQLFFNKPELLYYSLPAWKAYQMTDLDDRLANSKDGIYVNFEGEKTTVKLEEVGNNQQGIITLGVDPEMTKKFDEKF